MRVTILIGVCVVLSACATGGRNTTDEPTVPPPLVVASDLDNLPFAGLDQDGTPIGRDVEIRRTF